MILEYEAEKIVKGSQEKLIICVNPQLSSEYKHRYPLLICQLGSQMAKLIFSVVHHL